MPLIYSPVDGSEWDESVELRPRSAFIMSHSSDRVSIVEQQISTIVREELVKADFRATSAVDVRRSGDFLAKILRLIRGFGVAIFSDATPARTLANIFFEVGVCLTLGKPTFLVLAGDNAFPSDFVRSEQIRFDASEPDKFRAEFGGSLTDLEDYGRFLETLGDAAAEAEEIDFEIAFERYRRAFLVSGSETAVESIRRLRDQLRNVHRTADHRVDVTRAHRTAIINKMTEFLRLTPR